MGANLSSPNSAKSKLQKSYHLDGFAASRIPTSKSTIGFRDKHHHHHHHPQPQQQSSLGGFNNHQSGLRSGFINSLSLKKLSLTSSKKRQQQQSVTNNSSNNSVAGNGCMQQSIPTICGSVNEAIYQDIYAPGRLLLSSTNNTSCGQGPLAIASRQPPAPMHHHHSRLSSKNLTKSLSCYTLKFNHNSTSQSSGGDDVASSRKTTVVHASTGELLKCLGSFVCRQFANSSSANAAVGVQPEAVISWIRALDRSLILQGWSEIAFINPANVVFLYMLLKTTLRDPDQIAAATADGSGVVKLESDCLFPSCTVSASDPAPAIQTERQLQCTVLTCLYLAYAYMGNEISYPLKPFIVDDNRDQFWQRCLRLVDACSTAMLSINADSAHFTDHFAELKAFSSTL